MRQKILSIIALAAMTLLPQGAWATLTPRSANGELFKAFVYGTANSDYVVGGGTIALTSLGDMSNSCWNLEKSGAYITCTLSSALQAGDKITVEVAFATTSNDNNKGNGLKLREKDTSETGCLFTIGESYTEANAVLPKEYTLVADDPSGLVGATSFTVFRNTGTNSAKPMLRSITITRIGSDDNMPEVLTSGATKTWNLTGLATEATTLASGLVSDNLFYSKNIKIDANFNSTYYVSFANAGSNLSTLNNTSAALMFIVPAGQGTITVNHATRAGSGNNFACKIGANDAVTNSGTTGEWTTYLIPYNVSIPTPVWIYNNSGTSTRSHLKDLTVAVGGANATIGTTGYTTFANVIPLDLSNITSTHTTTAYYASAAAGSTVTLTSTDASIPAGEGLVLKGTAGDEVFIAAAASGTAIDGNKMKGCTAKTAINNETANKDYFYVLSATAAVFQNIGTWCASNTLNIPAGKAYLDLTGVDLSSHALDISFEDGNTTAISEVSNSKLQASGEYYDLSGRRVAQPTRGLYIVNGKKVIIK